MPTPRGHPVSSYTGLTDDGDGITETGVSNMRFITTTYHTIDKQLTDGIAITEVKQINSGWLLIKTVERGEIEFSFTHGTLVREYRGDVLDTIRLMPGVSETILHYVRRNERVIVERIDDDDAHGPYYVLKMQDCYAELYVL